MDIANWLVSRALAAKYPRVVFLQKNDSLGELRHQAFIAFLVIDCVCYRFVTVKGVAHGESCGLELYGRTCSEVWQGKRWRQCQMKPIDRCYLSVSVILNV